MWMNTSKGLSERPASRTSTELPGSADSRFASAQPAEPPPTITKSYCEATGAILSLRAYQRLQGTLESRVAHLADLERQPKRRRGALGRELRAERRPLGQPHDARVVAEVVVAELRVAVEPELLHDGVLEGPRE